MRKSEDEEREDDENEFEVLRKTQPSNEG